MNQGIALSNQFNTAGRLPKIVTVYSSSLLQGLSLTLFPAVGPLLTGSTGYGLSQSQFGALFTPQVMAAIAASLSAAQLAQRFRMKWVLTAGLLANLMSMLLLAGSHLVTGMGYVAFVILLLASTGVGAGFGFTITALNAYAFELFPGREDSAVAGLHVLTGLGQVGASFVLGLFLMAGIWWGAPLAIGAALILIMIYQSALPLQLSSERMMGSSMMMTHWPPRRVWLFGLVAILYGAVSGTLGNWAPIYLMSEAYLGKAVAALGLSLFWGAVTAGRVIFVGLAARVNPKPLYDIAPFVVGAILFLLPSLRGTTPNLAALIVAGLALSFFFPYSVSLASAEYPALTATVSGLLVAGLQLGSGLSAYVIGTVSQAVGLATVIQLSTAYALVMALVATYLSMTAKGQEGAGLNKNLPCCVLPCVQHHRKKRRIGDNA